MSQKSLKVLKRPFYLKSAAVVAKRLLGKKLVRVVNGRRLSGIIVEVEAYLGFKDPASHTFDGHRTTRVESMYKGGGYAYVYFVYGMHFCFNVVVGKEGEGQAVLIRALEPVEGIPIMTRRRGKKGRRLANGPAKLCQALGISSSENGVDLTHFKGLFLEESSCSIPQSQIAAGPRIGVEYAGEAARWPLRFYIKDNKFVSKSSRRTPK